MANVKAIQSTWTLMCGVTPFVTKSGIVPVVVADNKIEAIGLLKKNFDISNELIKPESVISCNLHHGRSALHIKMR